MLARACGCDTLKRMDLQERPRPARQTAGVRALQNSAEERLLQSLDDVALDEQQLLVILSNKSLSVRLLAEVAARDWLLRPYSVKLALVAHPHTPRTVSLKLLRHVYLFDLTRITANPSTPPEVRRGAEDVVMGRLTALSTGERLSLARQGTPRILSALLADADLRIAEVALRNPRLVESGVIAALSGDRLRPEMVEMIATDRKWALRYDIRLALIRQPATSLRRMLLLIETVRRDDLDLLTHDPRMPVDRRKYIAGVMRSWGNTKGRPKRRLSGIIPSF